MDNAANNIPATVAGFNVTITQLSTGWKDQDTSIYKSLKIMEDNLHVADKTELGKGLGLLVSQILKFEAPNASVDVEPTGS